MKKKIFIAFLSVIFLFNQNIFSQAYDIKVTVKNLPSDTLILGYHFNNQLIPKDTVATDKKGFAVFTGKTALPGGMYFLYLPSGKLIDFLIDKNQKFSITTDTSDFFNTTKFTGNPENEIFIQYQKFLASAAVEQDTLTEQYKRFSADKKKQDEIKAEFEDLNNRRREYFNKTVSENPNLFFAKFLLATKQVEVPASITDPQKQYMYYRTHYFETFDVSDPRLLRTPIYEDKIDTYMDKVLPQHPDTLIKESDKLINAARTNDELFRYMLIHLFNKYASSQLMASENVYVYIAEKYYIPEAKWSSAEFISDLKKKVADKKNCLIGNKAKDILFRQLPNDSAQISELIKKAEPFKTEGLEIEKSKMNDDEKNQKKINALNNYFISSGNSINLYSINADYIILWFWTPDCSHCRKETPEFYQMFEDKKMDKLNVKVVSVYLSKDIDNWSKHCSVMTDWLKFIDDHNLSKWQHVWNPFDPFRVNYDIHSSPVLYLLDKDYKIIAKRIGFQQAMEIIENEKN